MRFIVYSILILMAFASTTFATILQRGDIIHIESWPDVRYTRFVKIDNDGFLKIPYYHSNIMAAGKSIEEMDALIKKTFQRQFPSIRFVTTFSGNASVKISVVGAVFYPGEYIYPTGSRLSTIVKELDMKEVKDDSKFQYMSSFNQEVFYKNTEVSIINDDARGEYITQQANIPENKEYEEPNKYPVYEDKKTPKTYLYETVSYRNIELVRDGEKTIIDLMQYFKEGALEDNPVIQEGDVVIFRYIKKYASIKGAVNFPNSYEIKDGESIMDIIDLTGGPVPTAYLDAIEITNPTTGVIKTVPYDSLANIEVSNHDAVFFPFNKKENNVKEIILDGEVARPGIYPISDTTSLAEVLKRAGGLLPNSDIYGVRITRNSDINVGPFEEEVKNYTTRIKVSDDDTLTKNLNMYLIDGDEVFIPAKSKVVHVAGYIGKPGSYEWVDGKDAEYYLDLAGGENRFAYNDLIRVIKAKSGKILEISEVDEMEMGDLIYVPEYIPPAGRPAFLTFKEVVVVLGSMAALILNSFLIYQNASN